MTRLIKDVWEQTWGIPGSLYPLPPRLSLNTLLQIMHPTKIFSAGLTLEMSVTIYELKI